MSSPSLLSGVARPATTSAASAFAPSLRLSIARRLMRYKSLYNDQIRPFLRRLPKFACESWCLLGNKGFSDLVIGPDRSFPTLQDLLRDKRGTPEMALEALRTIALWKSRLDNSSHKSFTNVTYQLQIGDVVRHVQLGHVGVIAAQLPLCLESDEWVNENLGSVSDPRMQHPWYLVLVARHDGLPMDFVRYGSQLTHHKLTPGRSIGFHRLLPMFFKGFDQTRGCYLMKDGLIPTEDELATEVVLEDVPPLMPSAVTLDATIKPTPQPTLKIVPEMTATIDDMEVAQSLPFSPPSPPTKITSTKRKAPTRQLPASSSKQLSGSKEPSMRMKDAKPNPSLWTVAAASASRASPTRTKQAKPGIESSKQKKKVPTSKAKIPRKQRKIS